MPRILEKQSVLNGRGIVFTYEDRNIGTYFYRERVEGTKKYRTKTIPNAKTLKQAIESATDIALEMREDEPHHLSSLNIANLKAKDEGLSLLEREEKLVRKEGKIS